jgi:hypothetical protein
LPERFLVSFALRIEAVEKSMNRLTRIVSGVLLGVLACCGAAAAASAAGERPVAVGVGSTSEEPRAAGPITFGMVFPRGRMPRSVKDRDRPTQVDIKRRWPDGSVKHAVLTVYMPEMAARGKTLLRLVAHEPRGKKGERPPPPKLPAGLGDVIVKFAIHKGPQLSASMRQAIKAGALRTWLAGSRVTEQHYKIAPADEQGKADPDLVVRFRVRHYPAAGGARVTVIVENCNWKSPGNIPYDVKVSVAGRETFALKQVGRWTERRNKRLKGYIGHPRGARWVKRFWLGRKLDDVYLHRSLRYLNTTGLLPRYDFNVKISDAAVAKTYGRWQSVPRQVLQNGWLTPYFPTTGGRGEIGPLPSWTVAYLLRPEARTRDWTLGHADLTAGCPVHLRDEKTDWVIKVDDYPEYSYNPRGSRLKIKLRDTAKTPWVLPARSHWRVDTAHQGSFAYVPYLFTGDYFYLEEMHFWANHNMISMNYAYRGKDKGLLHSHQIRGVAWALRNLVHAAALSPDDSRGQKYFEARLQANLAHFGAFLAGKLKRKPTPIGTYTLGATQAYTRGWDKKIRHRYFGIPGWQHNFLTWALAHTVDHGYAEAKPMRNYMMKWTVGLATHPKEIPPSASCAYYLFIGEKTAGGEKFCQSWKEIADLTWKRPKDVPQAKPPDPKGSCKSEYGAACRGVILHAERAAQGGASEALRWVDRNWQGRIPTQWLFEPIGE